jgi:hypothetical protein
MSERSLVRWSGACVALGGLSIAAYMLIHPWAERAGPVATTPQWVVSHGFHFVGALFLLLGLTGLYLRQRERTGVSGLVGFLLAFVGTALFVGTGLSSAFLWPAIAFEAPTFVASGGGMFTHPLALGPILAARIFLVLGFVWLGVVSFRAGVLPRWGSILVILGVVATNLPTEPVGPVPWVVSVLGGVVFCLGLVGWGWFLNGRGLDGALLDLEYQRIELIKFNLFDNYTFADYVRGRDARPGRALRVWPEMRLQPPNTPSTWRSAAQASSSAGRADPGSHPHRDLQRHPKPADGIHQHSSSRATWSSRPHFPSSARTNSRGTATATGSAC